MSKPIQFLVIHCTDTPPHRPVSAADIRRWHTSPPPTGRGWKQVGYRGVFHQDGAYEKLVDYKVDGIIDPWEITNGVAGINAVSAHVVYVGGRTTDTRTAEQKEAMRRYVINFVQQQPNVKVAGHYQFDKGKSCPNFDVPAWLRSIGINEKNIYNG